MRWEYCLLAAIPLSLVVGLTQAPKPAQAAAPGPPVACPKYECKTIHAFWDLSRNSYASAHHQVNLTANYDSARLNIFTQSSTEKKNTFLSGRYDMWVWDDCSPMCGKSIPPDGTVATWQGDQEVVRKGTGEVVPAERDQPREYCDSNGTGVLASNQANDNPYTDRHPPGN